MKKGKKNKKLKKKPIRNTRKKRGNNNHYKYNGMIISVFNKPNGLEGSDLLNDLCDRIDKKKLNLPNEIQYGWDISPRVGCWELTIKNLKTDVGLVLREIFNPNIIEVFLYPFNYSKGELHYDGFNLKTKSVKKHLSKLDKSIEKWFSGENDYKTWKYENFLQFNIRGIN